MLTAIFPITTSQVKFLKLWAVQYCAYQRWRKVKLNFSPTSFMSHPSSSCGTHHTGLHTPPSHLTVSKLKKEHLEENDIGNKAQHDMLCMCILHIECAQGIQLPYVSRKVFNKCPGFYYCLCSLTIHHWYLANGHQ